MFYPNYITSIIHDNKSLSISEQCPYLLEISTLVRTSGY